MRRTISAVILVLALGACSSTTGGHGSTGGSAGSGAPGPSGSSRPVATSTSAGTPAPSPTRGPLDCAPGSVTSSGAPFCYSLPRGFTDVSTQTNYGQGWTYRTLITIGGSDLVEVLGTIYSTDTDTLDAAGLRALYNRAGLLERGKLGFASVSAVRTTEVDGARAFAQDGRYTNGISSHDVRIYTGRTIVFVSCQFLRQEAAVQAACNQVLGEIQLART